MDIAPLRNSVNERREDRNMEMMTMDQLEELKRAMKEAEKDDTPYIGIKDDEIHVLGDPNKTEVKSADYMVHFAFPNTKEWRARAEANGDEIGPETKDGKFFFCKRAYNNIYLTPRRITAVVSALAKIEAFLFKIMENGEIKELTYEEAQSLLISMNGELSDATYEVVATVLRIPFEEVDFMLPLNTVGNAVLIAKNNPSAVNEADVFFA